jgi:hypothetical protein
MLQATVPSNLFHKKSIETRGLTAQHVARLWYHGAMLILKVFVLIVLAIPAALGLGFLAVFALWLYEEFFPPSWDEPVGEPVSIYDLFPERSREHLKGVLTVE